MNGKLICSCIGDMFRPQEDQATTYVSTGFAALDHEMAGGLHAGHLIVIAGRPSMGKTGLALQIAENVAGAGRTAAFFSVEMSEQAITERTIARHARVEMAALKTQSLGVAEKQRIAEVVPMLANLPLVIDDCARLTIDYLDREIFAMKAATKAGNGSDIELPPLGVIAVDYLQIMTPQSGETRAHEVSIIARELKVLAKEHGVPIIALSQISRVVERRDNKRPLLSDLSESGGLEANADVVLGLYRHGFYVPKAVKTEAEIIVLKNKDGPRNVTVRMQYEEKYNAFKG